MRLLNQRATILAHLMIEGPATTIELTEKYKILRPSNRVQELKKLGWPIDTDVIYYEREDGSHSHYAKYTLLEA